MKQSRQVIRLIWGLKQSFRNYVEATGGVVSTDHGAERTPDGAFAFASVPGEILTLDDHGKPQGQGQFRGAVQFQGHGGMLSVRLVDPIIEIGDAGGVITVTGNEPSSRLEIAKLDLTAITVGDAGEILIPTTLSMEGSYMLDNHYPLGTVLDPVRLTCAVSGD
tara:strand:- start:1804 stop:2295 length:492 start_codon:yes stop_codon:yes gene_type:complete